MNGAIVATHEAAGRWLGSGAQGSLMLRVLASSLTPILAPLLVAAVAAAMLRFAPSLRRPAPLATLGTVAAACVYGRALLGFAFANSIVFGFAALVAATTRRLPPAVARARRWRLSVAGMLVLAALFLAGRRGGLDTLRLDLGGLSLVPWALDMWLVLRLVSYLWETGSGRIAELRPLPFLAWTTLPFALLGPLGRFSELAPQLAGPPPPLSAAAADRTAPAWPTRPLRLRQVALGLGQVLAAGAASAAQAAIYASPSPPVWLRASAWLVTGPWSFYLTFAGFFNLMEALAAFCGLKLSPSFERPFGRVDIADFWAHWNMTATALFRDYLFYNRWGGTRSNVYLNTLIVFTAVGLWHSANAYWLLWGLLHGAGFCVYIAWGRRRQARPEARPLPGGHLAARIGTYFFVCSCWAIPAKLLALIAR